MEIHVVLILSIMLYKCYEAYKMENTIQSNTYTNYIPKDTDSKRKLCRKLQGCLLVDKTCVKWRRSYLSAIISTILIFCIIHFRFPDIKELVLYVFIIYIVYYMMWQNFANTVSKDIEVIGKNIIKKLNDKKL